MTASARAFLVAPLLAFLVGGCAKSEPHAEAPAPPPSAVALLDAPDESFTRGEVTINYRAIGAGEPILLVHGYGDNLKMWAGTGDSLARDFRVIAVDTRGFGKSSKPAGVASYGAEMTTDLVALLDHLGVRQAHVLGYSMGALIGAQMALSHPDRVRTVTLAAGAYRKDATTMAAMLAPWIDDLEHGRRLTRMLKDIVPVLPDSVARSYGDQLFAESDSAALVDILKSLSAFNVDWTQVAASKTPAVAIVGLDDPLRPYTRDIGAKWPGAKVVELEGTDHMTIFTAPRLIEEVRALARANPIAATAPTS